MTTPKRRGRLSPRPRSDRASESKVTGEDARRTEEQARAAARLAAAERRLAEARERGDKRAIGSALKQRERAARQLAGEDGDRKALLRGAAMIAAEKRAHGSLSAAGRLRAREVEAHALAIIASEGIRAPLDLLAVSVGARILGVGLALVQDKGPAEIRTATYACDRGLSLIAGAVQRAREDAEARPASAADAATQARYEAMLRAREERERHAVLDVEPEPEPEAGAEAAPLASGPLSGSAEATAPDTRPAAEGIPEPAQAEQRGISIPVIGG